LWFTDASIGTNRTNCFMHDGSEIRRSKIYALEIRRISANCSDCVKLKILVTIIAFTWIMRQFVNSLYFRNVSRQVINLYQDASRKRKYFTVFRISSHSNRYNQGMIIHFILHLHLALDLPELFPRRKLGEKI